MGIDRGTKVRHHTLADPADKIEPRSRRHTQHQRHGNQHQKILVDQLARRQRIAPAQQIDQPSARHGKGQSGKRRQNQRHQSRRDHDLIAAHKGRQLDDRADSFGRFAPLGFFVDAINNRVGGFAHKGPALFLRTRELAARPVI